MATEPPANPAPTAGVTFSLATRSSFTHCSECGRPILDVGKRKGSHSCESGISSVSSSRRSSAVTGWLPSAVFEFLFGEKKEHTEDIPERMHPRRVDTISLRRTMTFADKERSNSTSCGPSASEPVGLGISRQMRNSVS